MSWLEALILGIVQGLTEFLPVSSSGHLQIGQALFGMEGEENLMFAVAVHAATVCSTLFVLWYEVSKLLKGLFRFRWNEETQYIAKILLSMLPVAVVGVLFKKQIEAVFGSGLLIVGVCLLVTAALLAFTYFTKPRQKEKLSFKDALIVGLAQACAVLPGLSRSGATIATGLFLGNKKETIAKFSFLMVLIPVMGEALLDLLKGNFAAASAGIPTLSLAVGFIAAFVAGTLACKWMISIVKKGKLIYFAIYCALVGAGALIFN